jgi:crotonobetainyl-CoA:carnitine CoA-transferase CaiB-like acyl-CoA transferase
MTGMYAAVACLAALAARSETGRGDHIDLAMLDVAAGFLANQAMNFLISGGAPERTGNRHPNIQPQDVFLCADGQLVLAVGNDQQFRALCTALGLGEVADDPRFSTNAARVTNLPDLHGMIGARLADAPLAHWLDTLGAAGVPTGPINTVPMVFDEPQIRHREMLRQLPHPLSGAVPQVVSPMRFRNSGLDFNRPPPLLGEHSEEVRRQYGLGPPVKPKP